MLPVNVPFPEHDLRTVSVTRTDSPFAISIQHKDKQKHE